MQARCQRGLANHTILLARDGTERYIDDSAAPIRDGHGVIGGVVLVFRDIGEKRRAEIRLEISESRFRRLFESSRDGILIADAATETVEEVNRSLVELLRVDRAQLVGKSVTALGLVRDEGVIPAMIAEVRAGGFASRSETVLEDHDGRLVPIDLSCTMYKEDSSRVIQFNVRDAGERKRHEMERAALLAHEHAARVEAQAAARANRARDQFLATLSDEMRTPLNAIIGWTSILSASTDPALVAQGVAVIARNAQAQAKLIEEVLDVSRIISDKLQLDIRPCNIDDVIHAAVETVRPEAEAKNQRLELDVPPELGGVSYDVLRMQQVFWNVLSNAVKFTPPGGHIRVRAAREGSQVAVEVADTGEGIDPDVMPSIFDRFEQADSTSRRKFSGLGLGLAIAHRLVEMHHGRITAESAGGPEAGRSRGIAPARPGACRGHGGRGNSQGGAMPERDSKSSSSQSDQGGSQSNRSDQSSRGSGGNQDRDRDEQGRFTDESSSASSSSHSSGGMQKKK